jgi:hypothetical protein
MALYRISQNQKYQYLIVPIYSVLIGNLVVQESRLFFYRNLLISYPANSKITHLRRMSLALSKSSLKSTVK